MRILRRKTGLYLLCLLIFYISICSCTSKATKPFEDDKYWNHVSRIDTYYNFITNALAVNDKFYAVSNDYLFIYDDLNNKAELHQATWVISGYHFKPIITHDIVAQLPVNFQKEIAFSSTNPRINTRAGISTSRFGEEYKDYYFWAGVRNNTFGAINSNGRFLTIMSDSYGYSSKKSYVVYADIGIGHDGNLRVLNSDSIDMSDMLKTIGIDVNSHIFYFVILDIFTKDDKFFISFMNLSDRAAYFVEINEDMAYKVCEDTFYGENMRSFFEYQGYLFTLLDSGQIEHTSDGVNWTNWAKMEGVANNFTEIDNYLFWSYHDQLYLFGDSISNVSFYRLPTSNIQGRTISSINKFKDNLVITTSSGIFYKSLSKIMKDKELIRVIH